MNRAFYSPAAMEIPWLLRQLGVMTLVLYCLFNIANVLLLRVDVSFVGQLLLVMSVIYVLQRFVLFHARGLRFTRSEGLALLLVLMLYAATTAQKIFLVTFVGEDGVDTLEFVSTVTLVSVVWMMIGGAAAMATLQESSLLALGLCFLVLAMFLAGVDLSEGAAVAYGEVKLETGLTGISHLTMEKFVITLLALAYALSTRTRFAVLLVGFVVLFLMSGRTAFAAFFLTAILINLRGNVGRNLIMMVVASSVILFAARYFVESGIVDTDSRAVREMLFLDGVEEDNSFVGRKELLRLGLLDLPEQFMHGDFTLNTRRVNAFGGYIHNLLSAWQLYGFFVFAAIVVCLAVCASHARRAFSGSSSPSTVFGCFMLIYVIINVIVAKSVLWNLLWFVLGFWLLRPVVANSVKRARSKRSKVGSRKRRSVSKPASQSL